MHPGLGEVMHRARCSVDSQEATNYLLSDESCTEQAVSPASDGKVKLGNTINCNSSLTTTTIPPWNETYSDSVARLERTIQELQQTHAKRHESILVVTHGDALQAAATVFMGPTIYVYDLKYCALMVLDAHGKLQSHYWLGIAGRMKQAQ